MIDILQNMLNQQRMDNPQNSQDELLIHQEPIAAAMNTLFKIIKYERRFLSPEVYNSLIQSLQEHINQNFEQLKIPQLNMSEIVSINGDPIEKVE